MNSRQGKKHEVASVLDMDFVGGKLALNFINTQRADAGRPIETLHTDHDVRAWMKKMGVVEPLCMGPLPDGALLQEARALRRLALVAVEEKKAGKRLRLTALNDYLSQAASHLVVRKAQGFIELYREYIATSAEQFLAPIAEAIAELLTTSNFDLIRQCESVGCVLWFADRPNGRPRRFCIEETCGTRTRVAAYRARCSQQKAATS